MAANKWQKMTPAFLIGVGVGAAVGVLFAPKSGQETRDRISDAVSDVSNAAKDGADGIVAQGSKLSRRAQQIVEDTKGQVRDITEAGEKAFRDAKTAAS